MLRAPGILKKLRIIRVIRLLRMARMKRLFEAFKDTFKINPGIIRLIAFLGVVL